MLKQAFGGPWTEDKLDRLGSYLRTYARLFQANERAKKFTRIYVDAFAGSGLREVRSVDPTANLNLFPELLQSEAQQFLKGSPRIALEVEPAFHKFIFVDWDKGRVQQLEALKQEFPSKAKRIEVVCEDANMFLRRWCSEIDWRYHRAIVFLDPYGMQVEWASIEALARTKGIDLWMLFPLSAGVIRLLQRKRPPKDEWAQSITRILGTEEWKEAWYAKAGQTDLFGEEETPTREANWERVTEFVVKRLKTVFVGVYERPLVLRNSKNVPLYLLCFGASNEKGAKPALRIAGHILSREAHHGRS